MLDWLPGLVTVTVLAAPGADVVEVPGPPDVVELAGRVVAVPEFPLGVELPHALAIIANSVIAPSTTSALEGG